jgi:peptidyl-prolyl isomerase D
MLLLLQTSFYRIIDRFIDQGGADTDSVFGGTFKDDPGVFARVQQRVTKK